ncbi:cysteine desulfurase family protein [uncultured Jatrophihabitans sp.]|uniref:cysteine desulfurase family protein n=1 Tax=uncultured Jatrophihabitans sp. TaxID=1610747 RepID=UPI0035C9A6F6
MPYLDHAATTPMLPEAVAAVTAAMGTVGNPSSLHAAGRAARRRVEESRESIAASLGARPSEVIFTAGGTESDNLAIKGLYWARRSAEPARRRVVISAVEHHAIFDAAEWLVEHEGTELVVLPVDPSGAVDPADLRRVLAEDPGAVALVSVMWANNEIGTIQPVRVLADVAHEFGVPMHSDAVQAVGGVEVDFAASGLDALTMTGHKIGGPPAAGVLLLRRAQACVPLLHGGGQEREVRSGTLDAPGAVGLAVAAGVTVERRVATSARVAALRDDLEARITAAVPDVVRNGGDAARLPNIANLSFAGCEGDALLMLLDAAGVECSTGSACSAGVAQPSHVLRALGADAARARGSLRFSLGSTSTRSDVDAAVAAVVPAVERARAAGLATVAS